MNTSDSPADPKKGNESESGVTWGAPSGGLRLGLLLDASKLSATLYLENVGTQQLTVLSHVRAGGEVHLDWYRIELRPKSGDVRQLRFHGDRDRSARVQRDMAPGERFAHEVSLADWAARAPNGARPIERVAYEVVAFYEVDSPGAWWTGRLETGPVALDLASP